MTATATELQNFLWHCEVAVLLSLALPASTSTNAHVVNAIRKATYAAVGSKGVRHASARAKQQQAALGLPWSACSLIREHSIPVSVICDRVRDVLSNAPADREAATRRTVSSSIAPGLWSPVALQIAEVVMQLTVLAWITEEDDQLLTLNGLAKRMPHGWKNGDDPFARYSACAIEYAEV